MVGQGGERSSASRLEERRGSLSFLFHLPEKGANGAGMERAQVIVDLKQSLVVPGFRKKGLCIRPAAQQGLVDGENFCSRMSGRKGKIMFPCMCVIFHRKKVVDDKVQDSIPAHQGHGAGRG